MNDEIAVELTADELRARAEGLEQKLREAMDTQQDILLRAELKVEAIRAGMVDLDGLKLLDAGALQLNEQGEIEGGAALMQKLRRGKPWLFGQASSSSPASPPPAQAPARKLATDMSADEWRVARADLLRRRG